MVRASLLCAVLPDFWGVAAEVAPGAAGWECQRKEISGGKMNSARSMGSRGLEPEWGSNRLWSSVAHFSSLSFVFLAFRFGVPFGLVSYSSLSMVVMAGDRAISVYWSRCMRVL